MRVYCILSILLVFILLFSCSTISARYKSGTTIAREKGQTGKKNIAVLTQKQESGKKTIATFTSPLFPAVTIYGEIEEQEYGFVYYMTKVRLIANWPNGWTEGNYEASGKLLFTKVDERFTCHIEDPFKLWDITSGEIRYYNIYYRKEDGLVKVKNRVDRLCEISRFLKERGLSPVYGHIKQKTMYGPGFTGEIIPFLFPERKNFSKLEKEGLLPDEYYKTKGNFPVQTVWGADLSWRTDYTSVVFPEHLVPLRNSGTLWRDYEEAPLLFFSLYNITWFFDTAIHDESFIKISEEE
ncbi:MAG: hypothetical protein JXB88_01245 [Spirochaetales bacterium]|nr:hypothetical protein [Spirochaetales bacterium]